MTTDYDTDILLWSKHQAELLRQEAARAPADSGIDWENVIEEIESVGAQQRHAFRDHIVYALTCMLKEMAWPTWATVDRRRANGRIARADAARRFTPTMRDVIDLERMYRDALRGLPDHLDGVRPLRLPEKCPVTLDDLLAGFSEP